MTASGCLSELGIYKSAIPEICKHCDCDKEAAEEDPAVHFVKRKRLPWIISVVPIHCDQLNDKQDTAKNKGINIVI